MIESMCQMPRRRQLVWALLLLLCASSVRAVDLTLPDLDDLDRSLAEFRGQWILVNFWATWCPPCVNELPELELFYQAHKDRDALVIGINMEEISLEPLKRFVDKMSISYPILLAPVDGYTALGRISALPTSILVSPEGDIVTRHVGGLTAGMIEQLIDHGKRERKPGLNQMLKSRSVQ